jgi:hypothetical protein
LTKYTKQMRQPYPAWKKPSVKALLQEKVRDKRLLTQVRRDARNLKKDKIIQYIDRLRVDARRLTSESVSKEVEKLDKVYAEACGKKQYSAAVNAIRLKSQLLGFLIEKKEVQHSTLDAMNDDEMSSYLDKIAKDHNIQ